MCGLRVKINYTFSAAGTMVTIFISVLGTTEREIPKEPIFGGGGLNMRAQQSGIIIFMHGENAMDKKRYQIYREEILPHFFVQIRAEYM